MADLYVRSTDGSDADGGTTWALAKQTMTGAAAIDAAGDRIFVSDNHAESTAASITIALAGTQASPTLVICGDDAAEPPTAVAATGSVTTTGNSNITLTAVAAFIHGLIFNCGTGASGGSFIYNSDGRLTLRDCVFNVLNTNTLSRVAFGNSAATRGHVTLNNVNMTFSNTSQGVMAVGAALIWEGGGVTSGSAITSLIKSGSGNARGTDILLSGLNLTGCATALAIFTVGGAGPWRHVIRNCRLPASWSGTLVTGTFGAGQRVEMYNCDSGDTNYRLWVEDAAGSTRQETTIVRSGGASDGTTALSWKLVTSADAEYPMVRHETPEIVVWNDTVGSAITVTAEIVHDSQGAGSGSKFQDDEVWLEVMYLGTSGFPLGVWESDSKANVLSTAANQADSSETWTTTGLASPVKQALSDTFTAQEKGYIHARVVCAKASKTLYICPKLTVA